MATLNSITQHETPANQQNLASVVGQIAPHLRLVDRRLFDEAIAAALMGGVPAVAARLKAAAETSASTADRPRQSAAVRSRAMGLNPGNALNDVGIFLAAILATHDSDAWMATLEDDQLNEIRAQCDELHESLEIYIATVSSLIGFADDGVDRKDLSAAGWLISMLNALARITRKLGTDAVFFMSPQAPLMRSSAEQPSGETSAEVVPA
jgi:hypothetical protein